MRSIVYAGNDFSDVCSAEVVARSANPIIAEYMRVPGRAGALLVTGYIPPVDVTVRLFMDMGYNPRLHRHGADAGQGAPLAVVARRPLSRRPKVAAPSRSPTRTEPPRPTSPRA